MVFVDGQILFGIPLNQIITTLRVMGELVHTIAFSHHIVSLHSTEMTLTL